MRETALHLIKQHGYLGLYFSLALGMLGIPVPDETLMTFTGYMVYAGRLRYLPAVIVSVLGSISGMSLSYWIGRLLGLPFITRYGRYLHLTPERFDKGRHWFERFGGKAIVLGYFVPGFRHLTAYVSGISKLSFLNFLGLASIGAGGWVLVFITVGRLIGKDWALVGRLAHRYMWLLVIVAAVVIIVAAQIRKERRKQF